MSYTSESSKYIVNSPADLLDAAAEVIEQVGWCRGTLKNQEGEVCARGAMNTVLSSNAYQFAALEHQRNLVDDAEASVLAVIPDVERQCYRPPIVHWNNHQASSAQEVIDTFRLAAKTLRDS